MDITHFSKRPQLTESNNRGNQLLQNQNDTAFSKRVTSNQNSLDSSFETIRQPSNSQPQMEQLSSVLYVRTSSNPSSDSSAKDLDSQNVNSCRSSNFHRHSPIPTSVSVTISRTHALTRPNPLPNPISSITAQQTQNSSQDASSQPSASPITITLRVPSGHKDITRLANSGSNRSSTGTSNEDADDGAHSSRSITPLSQGMAQLECLDTRSNRSSPILSHSASFNDSVPVPVPMPTPNSHLSSSSQHRTHPAISCTSELPFHTVDGGIRARTEQLFLSDHLSDVCFVLHDSSPDCDSVSGGPELRNRSPSRWSLLMPDSAASTSSSSTASTSRVLRRVPAHRLVLALGSPVFHALFFGPFASAHLRARPAAESCATELPEIDVRDVESRAFCVVLRCDLLHCSVLYIYGR